MHNEKQNNLSNWKDKLEDFSSFPGEEMLDKNESWNKLHNRLREKPRNNKMIFYWLAAACLLLIFFVPKIINKKNENDLVKNISTKNKKETKADVRVLHHEDIINKPAIAVKQIEKKADNNFDKKEKINKNLNTFSKKNISVALNVLKTNEPVIINEHLITDTPAVVIASLAVKKKLRVLHINEIENANEGTASLNDHIYNLPFAKTNDISKQKTSATPDYAGLIKIKIYSSN